MPFNFDEYSIYFHNSRHMTQTIDDLIQFALQEDCPTSDISSLGAFPDTHKSKAKLIAKEPGIFYGHALSKTLIETVGNIQSPHIPSDGTPFKIGDELISLEGQTLSILRLERVLLNFLQRLCGISTITNSYVSALNNSKIKILDTRKTTPLFRELEKGAVVAGGGYNHRFSLSDMVLLKENHLTAIFDSGGEEALTQFLIKTRQQHPDVQIEIEIETLDQLRHFPLDLVDIIMLDNMSLSDIELGINICKDRGLNAEIELSGNIELTSISQYSSLSIDRLSIGRLTHSVKAIDPSLLLETVTD